MRGSHHPCAEFPGLYTRCAHYEGFPPCLCLASGSTHPLGGLTIWKLRHCPRARGQ
ncbi:unnamed protein product [Staurois parvus]|uniref:Uncharacterized protein n=1 Tax=Staurois parvus TaxID=386267 RepID=A0ABN9FML0_9NEOB|nr:unnamed protein product [Staurois parvus]